MDFDSNEAYVVSDLEGIFVMDFWSLDFTFTWCGGDCSVGEQELPSTSYYHRENNRVDGKHPDMVQSQILSLLYEIAKIKARNRL